MKRHRIFSENLSRISICHPERIFFAISTTCAKKERLAVLLKRFLLNDKWGARANSKGREQRTKNNLRAFCALCLVLCPLIPIKKANAQFFDPQSSVMLGVLREISSKHNVGLAEQRIQTAKMIEQLKQFYDTYTVLRQDVEFTQSLYRDFQAIDNMQVSNTFAVTNLILNGDRLNYWLPSTTQQAQRSVMDSDALLRNADALRETYDGFAVSAQSDAVPANADARLSNAYEAQEAFSRALFEQGLRSQKLAVTYDSLATELYRQVVNDKNKFTEAERTQLLLESVKMRNMSNTAYEKYLEIMQQVQNDELALREEKLGYLRSKVDWKALKSQANQVSKVRYGFFDITPGAIQ